MSESDLLRPQSTEGRWNMTLMAFVLKALVAQLKPSKMSLIPSKPNLWVTISLARILPSETNSMAVGYCKSDEPQTSPEIPYSVRLCIGTAI